MKSARIDIGSIRREQIVEAAIAVIAEKGLQNLSLSEIETKAGMSRGQLTYYFPTKEAILLAVFDRVLHLMHERVGRPDGHKLDQAGGWEWVQHLLTKLLGQPPPNPVFPILQYTFLAQIGQREDFRRRLAELYEEWRNNLSQGLAADAAAAARRQGLRTSPRAVATVVQALLHGLAMQAAADPNAFDRDEMLDLCLDLLGTYLQVTPRSRRKRTTQHPAAVNGSKTNRTASTEG